MLTFLASRKVLKAATLGSWPYLASFCLLFSLKRFFHGNFSDGHYIFLSRRWTGCSQCGQGGLITANDGSVEFGSSMSLGLWKLPLCYDTNFLNPISFWQFFILIIGTLQNWGPKYNLASLRIQRSVLCLLWSTHENFHFIYLVLWGLEFLCSSSPFSTLSHDTKSYQPTSYMH